MKRCITVNKEQESMRVLLRLCVGLSASHVVAAATTQRHTAALHVATRKSVVDHFALVFVLLLMKLSTFWRFSWLFLQLRAVSRQLLPTGLLRLLRSKSMRTRSE